ncbi:FAD-dependent oxidoreductase [Kamptonema sp. UHCC 0994]|uniref:NAD(P)/FAD-dependent oxidoreductase n=1 Tax=Kamptonema sp. UHCC 0994 TaxID=3031329 RepID=UPI0023BA1D2E|nr:FAD-dependent oxidoreductase [Kamptonema sp. UHCC 0994]MDF0554415.1 FAD-dependent oxidoreductase [Kamptonema sp. UHCC 0994]
MPPLKMDARLAVFDIAVIGAGMAGLICAQQLRQAGYSVAVIEKSRGAGGRVATRRLHGTRADHGARYLERQGEMVQQLIEIMRDRDLLQFWTDTVYEFGTTESGEAVAKYSPSSPSPPSSPSQNRYAPPAGMNSIGKFLANNLEIWYSRRAIAITPTKSKTWHLTLEAVGENEHPQELTAKAVVVAIPAPQALMLLAETKDLPSEFIDRLHSIDYDPCITVMAGYPTERQQDLAMLNPTWKAISFPADSHLAWIGLDSSKRQHSQQPVFVVQSSPTFAENYLESPDLELVGKHLLERAAEYLIPWLSTPEWLQVHRWRYAFCQHPLSISCLPAMTLLPLVCAGDWCGGNQIEGALHSGLAAASWVNSMLANNQLPDFNSILRSI